MFKAILTIIAVAAMSVLSAAEKPKVIFADDFTRADADKVGNGWKFEGYRTGVLRDGAAFFDLDDGSFCRASSMPLRCKRMENSRSLFVWIGCVRMRGTGE